MSVPQLARSIAKLDADVELMSLGDSTSTCRDGSLHTLFFKRDWARAPLISGLYWSDEMHEAIRVSARAGAIIHTHGMWRMPNVMPALIAKRFGRPLFFSPRGSLSKVALSFSPLKKKIFLELGQRYALDATDCFHATSDDEASDIRSLGFNQPIAVIPNGIELPSIAPSQQQPHSERTILSLGRLHPKKGLDNLLRAWALLEQEWPEWKLRIAGPAERGHDLQLRLLANELGLSRVSIEGAVFGADKQAAYRNADVFILPTRSENFGLVVVEALAQETPVISTRGAPWSALEDNRCGWWVEQSPASMAASLKQAMAMPRTHLREMGARGRQWVARRFCWSAIASQMLEAYRWQLGIGEKPSCVQLS